MNIVKKFFFQHINKKVPSCFTLKVLFSRNDNKKFVWRSIDSYHLFAEQFFACKRSVLFLESQCGCKVAENALMWSNLARCKIVTHCQTEDGLRTDYTGRCECHHIRQTTEDRGTNDPQKLNPQNTRQIFRLMLFCLSCRERGHRKGYKKWLGTNNKCKCKH